MSKKFSWCCGFLVKEKEGVNYCLQCNEKCEEVREKWETHETRILKQILEEVKIIRNQLNA